MPLVTGTDQYGRPVFGVPAYAMQQDGQPVDDGYAATAPQFQPMDYSGITSNLQNIKAQGTDATARAKYIAQQAAAQKAAENDAQYAQLSQNTQDTAQGVLDTSKAATDSIDQATADSAAQHQADAAQRAQELDAIGQQAFGIVNNESAQAAARFGSGQGDSNTQGKSDLRARIVAQAAHEKGVAYKWGGTTEKTGFDCSGLVKYAYGKVGIQVPRTSGEQAKMGVRVPMDKLQPGDLVTHPGHIAIYAGNGMMWESPHTGAAVRFVPVRSDMYGIHIAKLDEQASEPKTPTGSSGKFINAIGQQESQGNYNAINKDTGASGKYQVMPNNIGPWSKEALGHSVSVSEFRSNPKVQEAVGQYKLNQYLKKYGPRGAAIAWYAGEGAAQKYVQSGQASNKSQGKYPTISGYAAEVLKKMGY